MSILKRGLKIAVGGKGGVGKTTVCSIWAQLFAESGFDVLAIDADPDTNLAAAMGVLSSQAPEPLIHMKSLIGERTGTDRNAVGAYFRMNPEVSDIPEKYWLDVNDLKLLVLGGIKKAGSGCACSEGSFLRALLTHTILHRQEVVLIDLDAGVEFMGRSSIEGIDALVVVVEPGSRSLDTAKNISEMAISMNISQVAAIANKITEEKQIKQISGQLDGIPLLTSIKLMPAIQEADMTRTNVFHTEKELVNLLDKGKQNLMSIITQA
jgi:CO dehydrogenase maturation factor